MYDHINPTNGEPFFPLSLVEYKAASVPNSVWARIPALDNSYDHGFIEITYAHFQNAVDGMAQWLKTATGRDPGDTIAYIGVWDPRYVWMALGACKAGYRVVFPATLTSQTLKSVVLDQLGCKAVITATHSPPTHVADFIDIYSLPQVLCPPISYFTNSKHLHIPFEKSYEEAADDILCIMYTSGSTNDPKPILWTNSFAASEFKQSTMVPPEGWESIDRELQEAEVACLLPASHCGSLYCNMLYAPLTNTISTYPLPGSLKHAETFLQLIPHRKFDTALISPVFAEYVAKDPARVALVAKQISCLAYGGGPISVFAGETLSSKMRVYSQFACTENGTYPMIRPAGAWDPARWRTICFHPQAALSLDPIGDGTFEVVVKGPAIASRHDPGLPPAMKTFPQLNEWRTEDCFVPDPSHPGSWIYSNRVSDVIKYTDGPRFNPLAYEQYVMTHPAVSGALLYGSRRPNAVLLLEPASHPAATSQDKEAFIDVVWPYIEEANNFDKQACNIVRSRIIVTSLDKRLPRASKGTIQRGKARALYGAELASLL